MGGGTYYLAMPVEVYLCFLLAGMLARWMVYIAYVCEVGGLDGLYCFDFGGFGCA